jgi:hypothetical protein
MGFWKSITMFGRIQAAAVMASAKMAAGVFGFHKIWKFCVAGLGFVFFKRGGARILGKIQNLSCPPSR